MGKKLVLMTAGVTALLVPIIVGIMNAPSIRAQSAPSQSAPTPTPKFEVASVRRCDGGNPGAAGGGRGGGVESSPGRLNICAPLAVLIQQAYIIFANGRAPNFGQRVPLSGGPAWINSERYQINAKAEGTPSQTIMMGPMLQALFEDRFRLKVHREIKEVPVYALTVAKGGLKVHPLGDGDCPPVDRASPPKAPVGQPCGGMRTARKGQNMTVDIRGTSLEGLSFRLLTMLDRPVVDKTGISGMFDFHLEFAPDEATPRLMPPGSEQGATPGATTSDPAGPSIFTAVQEQLGLKLESAKGSGEALVIDHVERPSAN